MQLAVGEGPIGKEGGPAEPASLQQRRFPFDVEEGFLLASKARLRQVFRGGAGAHGHRWGTHRPVGVADRVHQRLRQGGLLQPLAGGASRLLQGRQILRVKPREQLPQGLLQGVVAQQQAIGIGGGGEA